MGGREHRKAQRRDGGEGEGEEEGRRFFAICGSRGVAVTQIPELVQRRGSQCSLCWGGPQSACAKDAPREFPQVPP